MSNEYRDIVEAMFGRNFQYTTISMLESEGLACGSAPTDKLTDQRALTLIRLFSGYLNGVTGQWFEPFGLTFGMNIRGETVFSLPNRIPIILLNSVSYHSDNVATALDSGTFRANKRNIELKSTPTKNLSNYLIDGIFGWLENVRFLETTLNGDLTMASAVEATLDDIAPGNSFDGLSGVSPRFQIGDVVIFEDADGIELGRRIVTGVDYATKKITFDKFIGDELTATTIPDGSVVKTYGRIPTMIEMACVQFVIDNYRQRATAQFSAAKLKQRIKMEKTDNYRYDTHTMGGGGGYALPDPTLTSDIIINRGLQRYGQPGFLRNL